MQAETLTVINEQEKESNPVYKIIYNKIRNLRKVLAQIAHIETVDPKIRKPAQVSKLNRKTEILAQIDKHEEFAMYYKKMVVQHDLVYDKIDDLIKISTLLTVGKRIDAEGYCPTDTKQAFENIYKQIFDQTCYNGKNQLSDQIVRVYHILTRFMETPQLHSQCRDYMTYLTQFEAQKQKIRLQNNIVLKGTQKIVIVQDKKSYKKQKIRQEYGDSWSKTQKLDMISQVIKVRIDSNSTIDSLPTIQELNIDSINSVSANQVEQIQQLILEKHETGSTTNPDTEKDQIELELEIIDSMNHKDNVWIKKHEAGYEAHTESSINHVPQNNFTQNSINHYRENRRTRNRKNKKQLNVEVQFNVRKCSDTSLQPTPEKPKGKRIRYIQKKD